MPLLKEWNINDHALAAIWKVEEPESFFIEQTGIASTIKNEKRRIEHIAGRFLLKHLKEDFPLHQIQKDEHDKPYVQDGFFFSISHSWPYIAAVIDPYSQAGIDIQTWNPNIDRIQYRFLSAEEQLVFRNDIKLLTLAWSAKEAAYKWNGKRNVEFIEDLPISFFEENEELCKMKILFQLYDFKKMIFIENLINIDFACSYISLVEDLENNIQI
jgi:phosphopantetheinyl transferase